MTSSREQIEYGVLDAKGRPAMPLAIEYPTLRGAQQRLAWMEYAMPADGPYRVVQRTRIVTVTEWESISDDQ